MTTAQLVLDAGPTKQQLADYANAISIVNIYTYAVTQTNLPYIEHPSESYGKFTAMFPQVKSHCYNWISSTLPLMLSYPTIILNSENLFDLEESQITLYLQALKGDPGNTEYKKGLETALNGMQAIIDQALETTEDIEQQLDIFSNQIIEDAETLDEIAEQALKDAQTDQEKIVSLNKDIDDLYSEIDNLQTIITTSEISIGVSIFIGLIGVTVATLTPRKKSGIGIIVAGAAGVTAAITSIVISNKAIELDNQSIQVLRGEIADFEQDIAELNGVSVQFERLVRLNEKAKSALTTVNQMWNDLRVVIDDVKSDLTEVDTDVSSAQYDQALKDLQEAEASWQEVVAFAQALQGIEYLWETKDGVWQNIAIDPPEMDGAMVTVMSAAA